MILPPEAGKGATFKSVLRAGLTGGSAFPPPCGGGVTADSDRTDGEVEIEREAFQPTILYAEGDPEWFHGEDRLLRVPPAPIATVEKGRGEGEGESPSFFIPSEDERRPSEKTFSRQWGPPTRYRRGTAIHACFEQVVWLDEQLPDRGVLENFLFPKLFDRKMAAKFIGDFYSICRKPGIRSLLSLETYRTPGPTPVHEDRGGSSWTVARERPFLTLPDHSSDTRFARRGIIDRLVLRRRGGPEGPVVGADILDYKTDRIRREDGEFVETFDPNYPALIDYSRQLQEYRKVVQEFYGLTPSQISLRLAFVSYDVVYNVGSGEG